MNIEFVGRGIDLTEDLKSHVESKLSTFERHLKELGEGEVETIVTLTVEEHGQRHRVDIDVYLKTPGGGSLHAWEESNDIYKSLEFVIDDIDRQLRRLKERRLEQRKEIAREKAKNRTEEPTPPPIKRVVEEKMSIAKPLNLEEALMAFQDKETYFFPFRNVETGEINVLYRKKNGKFGLISP